MEHSADNRFALDYQEFEKEFGGGPLSHGPLEQLIKDYNGWFQEIMSLYTFSPPDTSIKTEDKKINGDVLVRIYYPTSPTGKDPLVVSMHSGGWVLGNLQADDGRSRLIAKACNAVVVNVEYRLAPEYKYPAALDDTIEAFRWSLANAASLGADPKKAVLTGTSAGANLAIAAALKLIDEGEGDLVTGIAAAVPITIHPDVVPTELQARYTSMDENAENTGNTKSAMFTYFETYGPAKDDKYVSVLLHDRLKDLPRTYLVECGKDTLRDDCRLFKEKLDQAGVPTKLDTYPGYPHLSWVWPSKFLDGHRKRYNENLVQGIKFALEG